MIIPEDIQRLVPTVKVVSAGCNMRCRYCYYRQRDQSQVQVMDESVLRSVISKTFDFSINNPVSFVWHGGEPMLAGREFFEKVLAIEEEFGQGREVDNRIQTNGTLINRQWADFFARHDFKVGLSIDGPLEVHDACRVFSNGRGSFWAVMRGLRYLQQAGLNPGIIALVSRASLGKEQELFDFMQAERINKILPKPCYEIDESTGQPAEYSITAQEYAEFMLKLMDLWLEQDDPDISIRNLEQIMIGLVGGTPSLCEFSGKCWLFPTVEVDGTVGACDSFPIHRYLYGDITSQNWPELISGSGFNRFMQDLASCRSLCSGCSWQSICHNRCLQHSFSAATESWHRNTFCAAKQQIFAAADKVVRYHS